MTLLERFDADPCWQAVPPDEIRRAIAIAQAKKDWENLRTPGHTAEYALAWIDVRADVLLRGKK